MLCVLIEMGSIIFGCARIAPGEGVLEKFIACWDGLDDPRTGNAELHDFHEILVISMCGVPCGGQGSVDSQAARRQREIRAFLRRLLRAIRANWPRTEIMLRGDSHYCCPEVLDFCRAKGLNYILGFVLHTTLRKHIGSDRNEDAVRGRAQGRQI